MSRSAVVRRALVVLLTGCAGSGSAPAPAPASAPVAALGVTSVLASAALTDDLALLEQVYRALHPGLYRYNTPAEVDALFAAARGEFARDRTLGDAFLVLTRLTAGLRCGHSYPNFSNQSDAVRRALLAGPRLPLRFRWLGERMVVVADLGTGAALPAGAVVERIGDVDTAALLRELLPLARADGGNDGKRRAYLEVTGADDPAPFDVLAPLLRPGLLPARGPAALTVRFPDGARRTVQARTVTGPREPAAPAAPDAPPWSLERVRRGGREVAVLRMPDWVMYHLKWDWEAALHAVMAELVAAGTHALVVDLRGNEGGNDVGDVLLAHLVDRAEPRRTTVRRVRFASVPAALRPALDTWDPGFFTLGEAATPLGDGWRELPASDDDRLEPRAPRFRGRLVVLIDASNSSATFQFAARVQSGGLGTLVGTTTGGSRRGINGGAFFFARLPRTGLEVDVPLIGTFPPGPDPSRVPDAGVEPDLRVEPTPADLAAGRDPQLDAALAVAFR
jgi:hypothetical protein